MRKRISFQTIPFIIMYFASIMLMGLGIVVAGYFDWVKFDSQTFWFTIVTTTIASLLSFLARFLQKGNSHKEHKTKTITSENNGVRKQEEVYVDTEYTKALNIISTFALQDNLDLDAWIRQENRERKIDEWKNKIIDELDTHEAKQKPKDLVALMELKDDNAPTKNKWINKKRKLLEQKSDAWIEKNIDFVKIDYDYISRSLITNGCLIPKKKKGTKSTKDYITKQKATKVFADVAPQYLISIGATVFFGLFTLEAVKGSVENWLTFFFKMMILAFNFAKGDDYADVFHREVTLNDLQFRIEMIKKYKAWSSKTT